MRLSRDLLVRGITYKLQKRAYGGLSTATARKLEQAGADSLSRGSVTPAPPISLRPGMRLVREWRGVTHLVLIHADGIEWRGQPFPLRGRAKDHGRSLVRPAILWPQAARELHIRRLENGLERPGGRSRPAPRHLASLVAADAFAG